MKRSDDPSRQDDRWPNDPPDGGRGDAVIFHDPDRLTTSGAPTKLAQVDGQSRLHRERSCAPAGSKSPVVREPASRATARRRQARRSWRLPSTRDAATRWRNEPRACRSTRCAVGTMASIGRMHALRVCRTTARGCVSDSTARLGHDAGSSSATATFCCSNGGRLSNRSAIASALEP